VEGFEGNEGLKADVCHPSMTGCVIGQDCKTFKSNSVKFKWAQFLALLFLTKTILSSV
jgi:hypothetical protein